MSTTTEIPTTAPTRKSSKAKRLAQNLALSLATFALCFAALEVILRIAGYGRLEIYSPDPRLYWRLKPNQDCYTKVGRHPVHVNSQGTRGPEFTVEKPAGVVRILSLGDSKTFGWGLTHDECYSTILGRKLQEHVGNKAKIEVINAGVNAWSYAQMKTYLREYGLRYNPDILILADANLWTQFSENADPAFVQKFMNRVRLKNFLRCFATYHYVVETQLRAVYETTRSKFIPLDPKQDTFFKEQQKKDPDGFYRDQIAAICNLAKTNGIKPVLLYIPTTTAIAGLDKTNIEGVKRQLSHQFNLPFVNMMPDLEPKGKTMFLEADEAHLNAEGNVVVADRLFPVITNMISL